MNIKSNSVLKVVLFLFLSVTALWIFLPFGTHSICNLNGFGIYSGFSHLNSVWFDPATWNYNFILLMLFRIFCFLFFIGLVIWVLVVIKEQFFDRGTNVKNDTTNTSASEISKTNNQSICIRCGKSIDSGWKVCAFCGEEFKKSS